MPFQRSILPIVVLAFGLTLDVAHARAACGGAPESTSASVNRFRVDELVSLPHPLRLIKQCPDDFGLTEHQRELLQTRIVARYPARMHSLVDQAWRLERRIRHAVLQEDRGAVDLDEDIGALGHLKREMTRLHIEALREFKTILTPQQFDLLVETSGFADRQPDAMGKSDGARTRAD